MTINDLKHYQFRPIMAIPFFLFIKRYLKTVPKGAKSFSDTHSDFDFSVTVIAIVEMFSPNKVWRL